MTHWPLAGTILASNKTEVHGMNQGTATSTEPAPRSPRRRLALLFTIPAVAMLLLFAIALAVGAWNSGRMKQAQVRSLERAEVANAALVAEFNRTFKAQQAGTLSGQAATREMQAAQAIQIAELEAAMAELPKASAPKWVQIFTSITMAAALPVLLLLVLARGLLGLAGRRLGDELRLKGYDWPTHWDAMWLLVVLRREARRIPPAADFMTVPDSRETADSLIAFVRMRRGFRIR